MLVNGADKTRRTKVNVCNFIFKGKIVPRNAELLPCFFRMEWHPWILAYALAKTLSHLILRSYWRFYQLTGNYNGCSSLDSKYKQKTIWSCCALQGHRLFLCMPILNGFVHLSCMGFIGVQNSSVLSKNERCLVNRVTCTVKPNQSLGKVVLHRGEEACWTGYSKQSIFGWMCPAQVIMQMDLQMSCLPGKKCITIAFSTIYSSSWWLWDALHSDQQEERWSHWLA